VEVSVPLHVPLESSLKMKLEDVVDDREQEQLELRKFDSTQDVPFNVSHLSC
jgi:hypothetical protein